MYTAFGYLAPQATRSRKGFDVVVADTVETALVVSENETALATSPMLELALGDLNSPSDITHSFEGLVYRDPIESGVGEFIHRYYAIYTPYRSAYTY